MNQLVSKSFIEASEAERAVANLLAMGYSQGDITIALNDRQRRSYMWDTARHQALRDADVSVIARDQRGHGSIRTIVSRAAADAKASPIEYEGELDAALVLGGPLASGIPSGDSRTVDSRTLIDLIMGAGVARREAERITQDVSRGGFLIAVSAQGEDVTKAKNALTAFVERAVPTRERALGAMG